MVDCDKFDIKDRSDCNNIKKFILFYALEFGNTGIETELAMIDFSSFTEYSGANLVDLFVKYPYVFEVTQVRVRRL